MQRVVPQESVPAAQAELPPSNEPPLDLRALLRGRFNT
jgi:hypothetical protein